MRAFAVNERIRDLPAACVVSFRDDFGNHEASSNSLMLEMQGGILLAGGYFATGNY
jgi:hypothetical protein